MKRVVLLIIVVAMTLSTLSSCGFIEKFSSNSAKDTTVTEEEWNAALASKNFTSNTETETSVKVVLSNKERDTQELITHTTAIGEYTETAEHSIEHTVDKRIENGEAEVEESDSENYYTYDESGDTWHHLYKNQVSGQWEVSDVGYHTNSDISTLFMVLFEDSNFSNFTYDEKEKAYVRDINIEYEYSAIDGGTCYIYFEDNSLVKLAIRMEGSKNGETYYNGEAVTYTQTTSVTITVQFSKIGTTTVTVPKYTVPEY